jgi:hypothetical protein
MEQYLLVRNAQEVNFCWSLPVSSLQKQRKADVRGAAYSPNPIESPGKC